MEPHKIDSYDISLRKIGERLDTMQNLHRLTLKEISLSLLLQLSPL